MKTLLITFIILLFGSTSFAQSIRSLLKKEQAFRSNEFYMLAVPSSEDAMKDPDFSRRFSNNEEGFLYLNIPDSIVVVYLDSNKDSFKISERFKVININQTDPLVVSMVDNYQKPVVMRAYGEPELVIQFYLPEFLINIEGGEKMMAYEFVNPVRIK